MNLSDLPQEEQERIIESHKKTEEFRIKYCEEHKCCPKCGSRMHTTTFSGFPLYSDRLDEYQDLNNCECMQCGDKHTTHERTPIINK